MNKIRYFLLATLSTLSLLLSGIMFPGSARAVSSYDHVVSPVSDLTIPFRSTTCGKDFTTTWADDFRNILSGELLSSFDNRAAWAVSVYYSSDTPDNSSFLDGLFINWWEPEDLPDIATFQSYPTSHSLAIQPTHQGYLTIAWPPNCSIQGGVFPYATERRLASYTVSSAEYYIRPYQIHGISVAYPVGYNGALVPTTSTTPYIGTVDCGGEDPLAMTVNQAGNTGAATLVPESTGRATWTYSLTTAPYSVTVDCGGTIAGTFAAVAPTDGTDWVCDVYGTEPYYCVLG